jgi:hypothetical protein
LKCIDETCKCDGKWQFWDLLKGMCMDYLTYDAGDCKEDSHCEGNLVCRITSSVNSCECPLSVALNKCDCKREIGDEWYWNEEKEECEEAESYLDPCDDSFMCKILTEGTICDSEYCVCPSSQYYNLVNKKCEDKLDVTKPCNQTDGRYYY